MEETEYEDTRFCSRHREYIKRRNGLYVCRGCVREEAKKNYLTLTRDEVVVLIKEAMKKQDSATYHGDQTGMDSVVQSTATQIMKLF